ncbi:MAG TPA: hypothetical protein VFG00_00230 [Acidothermaceae bacterium]|nr:hypothetical protein [Acidothermaceae bacterium]
MAAVISTDGRFLSVGYWPAASGSQTRRASDALLRTTELAQLAEQGGDGCGIGGFEVVRGEVAFGGGERG